MRYLLDLKERRLLDSREERTIRGNMKKRRRCENENDEIKGSVDRLSDLPESVIIHILSFLNTKHVVRSCILSKRWRHLWKCIPTLILHCSRFTTKKHFAIFVSKVLKLRDTSIALHSFEIDRLGDIEPLLLKKILNYICSHNTHLQELGISVNSDDCPLILSCVSSCHALTSLKLSLSLKTLLPVNPKKWKRFREIIFPKSLNLPSLTSLDLEEFSFRGGENGCAEPFSAFKRLNNLVLRRCKLRKAQILSISNETLVNLAMHWNSSNIAKIEISAKSLCTFYITGYLIHKICGNSISSIEQVNIDARDYDVSEDYGLVLLSWLQDLANVESLTVTSTTLQLLSLVPDLLEVKLSSLCYLKSLEVELEPRNDNSYLLYLIKEAMLKKAAAKSRKEVAELKKAFKARLEPPAIPDGIVDFLRQNSPSAKVIITTDLKQAVKSMKGEEIIKYGSQFDAPASASSAASASASSAAAPATVAPPNLHPCCAEKDDNSSHEDRVEKHQPNPNSTLIDDGQ